MLGLIRNSLFGSVETWPWQVLSKGDKVGPQGCQGPERGCARNASGAGAGSEGQVGQECAPDCALRFLPWARPCAELGRREGRGPVPRGKGICWEEGTQTGQADWLGESQFGEMDSAC